MSYVHNYGKLYNLLEYQSSDLFPTVPSIPLNIQLCSYTTSSPFLPLCQLAPTGLLYFAHDDGRTSFMAALRLSQRCSAISSSISFPSSFLCSKITPLLCLCPAFLLASSGAGEKESGRGDVEGKEEWGVRDTMERRGSGTGKQSMSTLSDTMNLLQCHCPIATPNLITQLTLT